MPWTKLLIEKQEQYFEQNDASGGRRLSYGEAVREALFQALKSDPNVFVMGQGVDDPSGMFGSTLDLHKKYGQERVFDTPLSENALTGVAVGAAICGMRPVYVHNRPDFLLLCMDQLVNHASKWSFMFGGKVKVPLVIKSTIGRGWGSAAQHSQAIHALFMHIPGLRLVMPSTAYDAKGLMLSSIADNNPVIYIEHRWLYKNSSYVPQDMYFTPFGKATVKRKGKDVTVVGISYMVIEALRAAQELEKEGIDIEVIDPRTLKPLDEETIIDSVKKTGRLVIADIGWKTGGAGAEIAAVIAEKAFNYLKAPVKRIACPDVPTPSGFTLENEFYKGKDDIIKAVKKI